MAKQSKDKSKDANNKPAKQKSGKPVVAQSPKKKTKAKVEIPKQANGKVTPVTSEEPVDSSKNNEDLAALYASLPIRHQLFIEEYLIDFNGTQSAIRAGYSQGCAHNRAYEILRKPAVAKIVEARKEDRFERTRMTTDRLLSEYEHMAEADFNELVEFRRVNCRHCWGIDHKYQYNIVEQEDRRAQYDFQVVEAIGKGADEKTIKPFDELGGVGYLPNKDPNKECPVCAGEGVGDVFFKDTRHLSRRARAIYAGAEIGKDGIRVKGYSKEKAMDTIAKVNKLFNENPDINFNVTASPELMALYDAGLKNAQAKDEKVIGRSKRMANSEQAG